MLKVEEVKLRLHVGAVIAAAGGDAKAADRITLYDDGEGKFNDEGKLLALQQSAAAPRPG